MFDGNIDNNDLLKCWKNKINQKADIFLKYGNRVKGISLKCGRSNSVHHENIQEFKRFLESKGIPFKVIDYYVSYHYGYAKDEEGNTDYTKCLSAEEYKLLYQDQIDIFNQYINKTKLIMDCIDRFLILGRNSNYEVEAFICGVPDDYTWILKYEMYDLILMHRSEEFTSPHVACMTLGPKKRNLDRKPENAKDRFLVCVRWNYIRELITDFRNNHD